MTGARGKGDTSLQLWREECRTPQAPSWAITSRSQEETEMNLQDSRQLGTEIEREWTWEMSTAQGSLPPCTHTSSAFCAFSMSPCPYPNNWWTLPQVHYQRLFGYSAVLFCLCVCVPYVCVCVCVYLVPDASLNKQCWRQEGQWRTTSSPSFPQHWSPLPASTSFLVWLWCPEEAEVEVWSHQVLIWGIAPLYSVEATSFLTYPFIQQVFGKHLLRQKWV